ncbi:unnamed protein product [Linum trigynum]|uniref:Uncharacterized protein n=1 Tax=Linum trigynum TaxID=586398 RepID=A0AAV2D1P9_9ROSI
MEAGREEENYVDWRGHTANPKKHGGVSAAAFTCVVEALENMVFLSNATNFVSYFIKSMHYSTAHAANMVTNFMATSFLLTVVGGFVTDSFLNRFWTFIASCTTELLGIMLLTIQAEQSRLQPPTNETPSASQAAILYGGLYAIAVGFGGIKASLPAHGADQLDHGNQGRISAFFNWFFFSLCIGGLMASTFMIWVQENLGWKWGLRLSLIALGSALCVFASGFPIYRFRRPTGSPITRILKVLCSAVRNWRASHVVANDEAAGDMSKKFRFLDKATVDGTVTSPEVEETRSFLRLLPIFGSTIMMSCCLAQLQTFSVEQGSVMDRKLRGGFLIPTQSLSVFSLVVILSSIPFYEYVVKSSRATAWLKIYRPLKRIGLGLALASASMAVAAAVEVERRSAASVDDSTRLSVFWLSWQFLFLGVSDMLTLGGMLEFFYSQAPNSMRSMCTALAWASTSMGFFLSSLLVTLTNKISGRFGDEWLGGHDLNRNRLDLFYAVLCVLNSVNLVNYVFWAKRY